MAVGPKHIRILRTDNLADLGTPDATDKILIIDLTDGELKSADASTVGETDHGGLAGLADDDHTQYLNVSRHDADDHSSLTITESQISNLSHLTIEQVQDNLGTAFIVGGNNLTATYDDVANTLTLSVDALDASDITTGTFADARIAESNVTQHQAALSITESQISDLAHYTTSDFNTDFAASNLQALSNVTITSVTNDEVLAWSGTAWINQTAAEAGLATDTHVHDTSDVTTGTFANARISEASVTQHQAALTITESQISDLSHTTDHGALTGRNDDDHTLYSLASGARAFTGTVAGVDPTAATHLATKAYIDTLVAADTFLLMGA